jgi:hypothetical protein
MTTTKLNASASVRIGFRIGTAKRSGSAIRAGFAGPLCPYTT